MTMPIPVAGAVISASAFGAPAATELNDLQAAPKVILKHIDRTGTNLASNFSGDTTLYSTASIAWATGRVLVVDVDLSLVSGGVTFPLDFAIKIKDGSSTIADGAVIHMVASAVRARGTIRGRITSVGSSSVISVTARRVLGSTNADAITGDDCPFIVTISDLGPSSGLV